MPDGRAGGEPEGTARRRAVLVPLVTAAAFCLVYVLCARTAAGQRWDAGTFRDVVVLHDAAGPLFRVVRSSPPLLLAAAAVPAGLAVAARAWRRLAAAAIVLAVSAAGARVLQDHLARPYLGDHGYPQNTFPSGHVALAAALCVGFVLLWPGGAGRAVVAAWGGVAVLSALANVVTFAHRPSDVVGSLLLVATVTAVTVQALRPDITPAVAGPRRPRGAPDEPR